MSTKHSLCGAAAGSIGHTRSSCGETPGNILSNNSYGRCQFIKSLALGISKDTKSVPHMGSLCTIHFREADVTKFIHMHLILSFCTGAEMAAKHVIAILLSYSEETFQETMNQYWKTQRNKSKEQLNDAFRLTNH